MKSWPARTIVVALMIAAFLVGCSHRSGPSPFPAMTNAPPAPNVRSANSEGFVLNDGRVVTAPPSVSATIWTDPAVQVSYVDKQPGAQIIRMQVKGQVGEAATRVEQGLLEKGWKRTNQLRSGPFTRSWFEKTDGSMAEILAADSGAGRSEVQLTVSPFLQPPPRPPAMQ